MQLKRRLQDWIPQDQYIQEPLAKTRKYAKVVDLKMSNTGPWGFSSVQSEHMMNMVTMQLLARLGELQKEVDELSWAKNLNEAAISHDRRREYVLQCNEFWQEQQEVVMAKIGLLLQDLYNWCDNLLRAQLSVSPLVSDYAQFSRAVGNHSTRGRQVVDGCILLQKLVEFIRNDRGSLEEALEHLNLLRIDSSTFT